MALTLHMRMQFILVHEKKTTQKLLEKENMACLGARIFALVLWSSVFVNQCQRSIKIMLLWCVEVDGELHTRG